MCFTGQLSAHSSTEGVQNIGLSEAAQNAENSSAVLPPAAGKFTADKGYPIVKSTPHTEHFLLLAKNQDTILHNGSGRIVCTV